MYGLLILALPQSPYVHFSTMTGERFTELLPQFIKDLEADIFPNVCFQGAFNVSNTRTVTPLFIPCNSLVAARELAYEQIRNILANPEKEIQHITNIGDWLGVPGKVMFGDDDDGVIVTDMYKYLVHEGKARLPFRFSPVDLSVVPDGIMLTHTYPRDNFYDQVYRDQGGKRTFLKYEARTDGSRENTHGEDHHGAKPVLVNGLTYPTLTNVAIAFNLPEGTVFNRLNSGADKWVNWQYAGEESAKCVVYKLMHKDSPKFYIGFTTVRKQRIHVHTSALFTGRHGTPKLQALVKELGMDGVYHEILFEGNEQACRDKEQELVTQYKDDPNLLNASHNTRSAISHHVQDAAVEKRRVERLREAVTTDEYRDKMSGTMKDAWAKPGRKEARSGAGNPFAKMVSVAGVVYGSVIEAVRAKAGGYTDWQIRTQLKSGKNPEIFYCDTEGNPSA